MLKATLYFVTESNLSLQASENSEANLGLAIVYKLKPLTIVTRSLFLDIRL